MTDTNVPRSISAAAAILCLDLFQRASPAETLREERAEVETGLATLRRMASFSGIASRGAALVQNLLEEEAKLPSPPPSAAAVAHEARPGKRRRVSEETTVGTTVTGRTEAAPPPQPGVLKPPTGFLPTVLSTDTETAAAAPGHSMGDPFLNSAASAALTATPPATTAMPSDSLPAEFVTAFLNSGFDPFDGAVSAL